MSHIWQTLLVNWKVFLCVLRTKQDKRTCHSTIWDFFFPIYFFQCRHLLILPSCNTVWHELNNNIMIIINVEKSKIVLYNLLFIPSTSSKKVPTFPSIQLTFRRVVLVDANVASSREEAPAAEVWSGHPQFLFIYFFIFQTCSLQLHTHWLWWHHLRQSISLFSQAVQQCWKRNSGPLIK